MTVPLKFLGFAYNKCKKKRKKEKNPADYSRSERCILDKIVLFSIAVPTFETFH